MLEALCADASIRASGILLLAPTGKAAVQLAARTKLPTQNLAQFLRKHERWDWDSGAYYLAPNAPRFHGAKTVVIDEASMLTEEMLAATIDALAGVDRLILCGDPRQLPPIGAGRPFADLVALLRDEPGRGGGVAELRTSRRQAAGQI
jgi:ATP-dependent exoDNAse (exonuclease V) alpha subunit